MNIKKYNKIHDEIMNRLEKGDITIESAKEVNNLAFDKYINDQNNIMTESVKDIIKKMTNKVREFVHKNTKYELIENFDFDKLDEDTRKKITNCKKLFKSTDSIVKKLINDYCDEFVKDNNISKPNISFNPTENIYCYKNLKKGKVIKINICI